MTQDQTRVDDALDNDRLLRFVDGALDDDQRVQVLTALSSRPETVARVEAYLHQNARLRALGQHLPMHDSRTFRADLQGEIVRRLAGRRTRVAAFRYAAAAAVALTVLGGGTALTLDRLAGSGTSALRSSAGAPEIYFPFGTTQLAASEPAGLVTQTDAAPTDLASVTWLAGQVPGLTLSAPELDGIGLHLVRGETLDANRAPAIRLIYADEVGSRVVLYAAVARSNADHAFRLVPEGHLSLQWRRGPMIFALVAPTDSPQLSAIVELVGKGVAQALPRETAEPVPGTVPAAAPADGGPIQSIAVPPARPVPEVPKAAPEPAAATTATTTGDGVITPPTLPVATKANEPKPL
jgi:anti-sigma factor RsiW